MFTAISTTTTIIITGTMRVGGGLIRIRFEKKARTQKVRAFFFTFFIGIFLLTPVRIMQFGSQ